MKHNKEGIGLDYPMLVQLESRSILVVGAGKVAEEERLKQKADEDKKQKEDEDSDKPAKPTENTGGEKAET